MYTVKQVVCGMIYRNEKENIINFLSNSTPGLPISPTFYVDLSLIYTYNPPLVQTLLKPTTIPELSPFALPLIGSYKHWFRILKSNLENKEFISFMYELIINQLNKDLQLMNTNEPISNLVEYMPKERTNVAKHLTEFEAKFRNARNLEIIDRLCKSLYPTDKKFTARKDLPI